MSLKDDICCTGKLLAGAALLHHADPSGVPQPRRVGMMLELLTRAAFLHHDDQGHDPLRYHAILKGLIRIISFIDMQTK